MNTQPIQVIKASAGSGKTFQLTYEYIKLLLGEKNKNTGEFFLKYRREYHSHILAVTFTNKATEEMKSRIVKELDLLSRGEGGYVKLLEKDLHTSKELLMEAARKALAEILFDYTNFNVSTIDAFFQSVMRAFAYELDCDYSYEVELDAKYATAVAISNFLSSVGYSEKGDARSKLINQWMNDYIHYILNESKSSASWDVFKGNQLKNMAKDIAKEVYQANKDAIAEYLSDISLPNSRISKFKKAIQKQKAVYDSEFETLCNSLDPILAEAELTVDNLSSKSGLGKLISFIREGKKPSKWDEYLNKPFDIAKWSTDKKWKARAKDGEFDHVGDKLMDLALALTACNANRSLFQSILSKLFVLGLLGIINGEMEKFMKDNNAVLLSDTNQMLRDVVVKGNVLFMYERLGTWIDHFLIDEFQDTSAMQYQNIRPLLEESASVNDENLIIGDEKQCIYRFRNSDPLLLQERIAKDFEGNVFVDNSKIVNWRSTPNVIKFNNSFFDRVIEDMHAEDTYSNVTQVTNSKNHCNSGAVLIRLMAKNVKLTNGNPTADAENNESNENEETLTWDDYVLHMLPEYINDIRSRGYGLKDIAILVNTNGDASKIISRLMEYNRSSDNPIDVVSAEAMLLSMSPAVRIVISTLRYFESVNMTEIKDPKLRRLREREDKIHRVLKDFDREINEIDLDEEQIGEILKGCFIKDEARMAEIAKRESAPGYTQEYTEIHDELVHDTAEAFNLISVIENIIKQMISPSDRENEKAFLLAFMDCVMDYCAMYHATIHSFLRWWDEKKNVLTVASPDGADAVNVMTVHKSKGLEFPCVIIPFANWDMCKMEDYTWINKEIFTLAECMKDIDEEIVPPLVPMETSSLENIPEYSPVYNHDAHSSVVDNLNKTYVAFTRAVNEMHIYTCGEGAKEENLEKIYPKCNISTLLRKHIPALDAEVAQNFNERFNTEKGYNDVAGVITRIEEMCDDSQNVYAMGDIHQTFITEEKKEPVQDVALEDDCLDPFAPHDTMPELTSVNRLMEVTAVTEYSESQTNGIIMHKLFDKLKRASSRDQVIRYARHRCYIPEEDMPRITKIIDKAITDERTKLWFANDNKVYNERPILLPNSADGKSTRRPDRIILTPQGEYIIIDYKFGDARKDKIYSKQIKEYISLLHKAGIEINKGYVWYVELDEILQVK